MLKVLLIATVIILGICIILWISAVIVLLKLKNEDRFLD